MRIPLRRVALAIACAAIAALSVGGSAMAATTYPLTYQICGLEVTFDHAPQRAIVFSTTTMEHIAAIGAEGSVIATVGVKGSPSTLGLPDVVTQIPSLQDRIHPSIGQEPLVEARPDTFISAYEFRFTTEGSGSREEWAARGVPTFVLQGGCQPNRSPDYTFDGMAADIRRLGEIFDRQEQAERVASDVEARVAELTARAGSEPVDVFTYDSGEDAPLSFGGYIFGHALSLAGGRDIFPEVDTGGVEVAWEQVAARDPEAILVIDYSNGTTDDGTAKAEFLRQHPALANTRAIAEDRILIVNIASAGPSLALLDDFERIVDFLNEVREG